MICQNVLHVRKNGHGSSQYGQLYRFLALLAVHTVGKSKC